mmetsp:Transcript_10602/g.12922  ORF Transcript_10602/g.12922 Transcript_10602/m.12922 type:complete len:200 (-) Transcript_10602:60-659(-)
MSPEEELLVTPYNTNKSTLRTISTKQPQLQPSSSLQVPLPPPPPPSAGRTPLQRQSSRCQSSIELKEHIQRAKQESWDYDSTNAATTHATSAAPNTGHHPGTLQSQPCSSSKLLEHIFVGTNILKAHKHHIDKLMETLRMEMDVVQKFERIYQTSTEDEILENFESMAVCLDQRVEACDELRRVMDRISRGAPPDGGEG